MQIPHSRLIAMLTYKSKLVGIHVIEREESSTNQAKFAILLRVDPAGSEFFLLRFFILTCTKHITFMEEKRRQSNRHNQVGDHKEERYYSERTSRRG